MAITLGNYGNTNYGSNSDWAEAAKGRRILKDTLNKDWYVYRVTAHSIVKPYPIFDMAGMPCAERDMDGDDTEISGLPEAFVGCPIASFAGMDGNLEFVDVIVDAASYDATSTPYQCFIRGLRSMLPGKNGEPPKDGFPTPQKLMMMQKNVSFSSDSILFRGAVQLSNGKPSGSKNAVNGILFRTFFYVPQKGARTSLMKLFNTRFNPGAPISADNCMVSSMFSANGCSIGFTKGGVSNSDSHEAFRVDPATTDNPMQQQQWSAMKAELQSAIGSAFNAFNDQTYFAKLREMFGPFQSVADCLNLMTAQQMVDMLLEYYPASWVWFGLKDTPYAPLVSDAKRAEAFNDPEMACRFGVAAPAPAPQPVPSFGGTMPMAAAQPAVTMPINQPAIQPRPQLTPPPVQPQSFVNTATAEATMQNIQYHEPDSIPMGNAPSQPTAADSLYAGLAAKYGAK